MSRSYGQRISLLTQQDLPALADAIVLVIRHRGGVAIHDDGSARYVRLSGPGMSVMVRDTDWKKLMPYLADGTLDPTLNPVETEIADNPFVQFDAEWIRLKDPQLRARVLSLLGALFTRRFPTSPI